MMLRFVTTLVVTVVGILAVTLWWSSRDLDSGGSPTPATSPDAAAGGSGPARPAPSPAPVAPAVSTAATRIAPTAPAALTPPPARPPVEARSVAATPTPPPPVPALPEPLPPPSLPEPQAVPPIPAPQLATRPAPEAPLPTLAPAAFEGFEALDPIEVEETELRPLDAFGVSAGEEERAEPEERAVAMGGDQDRSARLIRRLLDVYQDLGSRP